MTPDVLIENHGSIMVVQLLTTAARDWLENRVIGETTWWAGGLVVEPRYIEDLVAGMQEEGLVVK